MNIFRGVVYFLEWERRLPNPSDWPVLEDRKYLRGGFGFEVGEGSSGVCLEVSGYPHPMPEACVFQDRETRRVVGWLHGHGGRCRFIPSLSQSG